MSLYIALTLDALSLVFSDRTTMALSDALTPVALILLQDYFVWLSAQQRYGWPRLTLALCAAVAIFSLAQIIIQRGLEIDSAIEGVSCAMTAAGLCFAFSRSAGSWFSK